MLTHAFEEWNCVRIELKTDSRNQRSIEAIRRLGATEEGTLRKHMQTHQGWRDTVYFSILDEEWPTVKSGLESKLSDGASE
jgi:RimJ/RimL family protein N-acetyltransferase